MYNGFNIFMKTEIFHYLIVFHLRLFSIQGDGFAVVPNSRLSLISVSYLWCYLFIQLYLYCILFILSCCLVCFVDHIFSIPMVMYHMVIIWLSYMVSS